MRSFELVKPDNLAEASKSAGDPNGTFKAAGIDLLDRLKERLEEPGRLVNLLHLKPDLGRITRDGDALRIGALATLHEVANAAELTSPEFGALREAAGKTATPQIRHRATAGGNLLQLTRCWYRRSAEFGCSHGGDGPDCLALSGENRYHAVLGAIDCVRVHPSNLAPVLVALDARIVARTDEAERTLGILDLYPAEPFADEVEHTLAPNEILTEIVVPAQPAGARSAYRASREKASFDWPTTAAAVRVAMDGGTIRDARICLGAVAPNPHFVPDAAALLVGEKPSAALFRKVAAKAYEAAEPLAQNAYKIDLGQAVLRDALTAATGS